MKSLGLQPQHRAISGCQGLVRIAPEHMLSGLIDHGNPVILTCPVLEVETLLTELSKELITYVELEIIIIVYRASCTFKHSNFTY